MEQMVRREMFDVLSHPGKKQGGYMEFLPLPRMPLIFANFNGTSGDVDVITHECGHAFQGYLAGKDDIREHWNITMETATHSMSYGVFHKSMDGTVFWRGRSGVSSDAAGGCQSVLFLMGVWWMNFSRLFMNIRS